MDTGEIRRMILEGRGVVEISETLPGTKIPQIKEIRLEMIEEGIPIVSPFGLVQERVPKGPDRSWEMIVVCCLMNRTHARQVRPMMRGLFGAWPDPSAMATAGPELEAVLKPLGFSNKRATALRLMSVDYARSIPPQICYAVGEYGRDSLRIFVEGDTAFEPKDKFLIKYVDWVNEGRKT